MEKEMNERKCLKKSIIKIVSVFVNGFLNAGKSIKNNTTKKDVDPNELSMGIEVEYEHTTCKMIATKIALDHLSEIPDYYTRLNKMEKDAFKELGIKDED